MNELNDQLEKDIVGSVQTNHLCLCSRIFKPFCARNAVEKWKAILNEMRLNEGKERRFKLVQSSVQRQCLQWESLTVERKITRKEIQDWEIARTSFLIKSTYDVLPSPANLK